MKKLYNIIIIAVAAILLAACSKAVLDPLQGIYPAPSVAKLESTLAYDAQKIDGKRYFTLDLAEAGVSGSHGSYSGNGIALFATLVCNDYYLKANTYTNAEAAAAKNGNFITGATSVWDNGTAKSLQSGSITITKNNDNYSLSAILFATDGTPYKLSWKGELTYEADPEVIPLTQVFTAQSNLGNGVKSVTMSLGTADISSTFDMNTWTTTWSGSGNYLAIDLYSEDGFLHEGTYTPCAVGGVIEAGQYGIGYDTEMWGMKFENWGTCWWTVENGVTSAQKILSGNITVARSGSGWLISYGKEGDEIWCEFKGEIPALTSPDTPATFDGTELTKQLLGQSNIANGVNSLTFQFATEDVSSTTEGWTTTWSGTGYYLALDIYSADGTLAAGEYKACATGGQIAEGEFGIGFDTEMWGMTFENWGTCWWTVTDGATSAQKVLDGTVKVEVEGAEYTITLESSIINARYKGAIAIK